MSGLREVLKLFSERDGVWSSELVLALRASTHLWVPRTPEGGLATVQRDGGRFLPTGTLPGQVIRFGRAVRLPAEVVWATVPAGLAEGVVVDADGPSPTWILAPGVERIAGPFGLRLKDPLRVRTRAEAEAVLTLVAWPPEIRMRASHELDEAAAATGQPEGRVVVCRWEGGPPDALATVRMLVQSPRELEDFGPGGSSVIDPAGWRWLAQMTMAQAATLPGFSGPTMTPEIRAAARFASACLRQVLAAVPAGRAISEISFFTPTGRTIFGLDPQRFERGFLEASVAYWDRFAERA